MVSELDRRTKSDARYAGQRARVHGSRHRTGPEGVKEEPRGRERRRGGRGGDSRQGVFSLVASARASRRDVSTRTRWTTRRGRIRSTAWPKFGPRLLLSVNRLLPRTARLLCLSLYFSLSSLRSCVSFFFMRNSGGSPTSKQPRRRHSRSMRGKRGGDSLPSPTPRCVVAATGSSRSCRFRFCLPSRKENTLGRTAMPSLSSSCWALGRRLATAGETRGPHPGRRRAWKRGPSSFLPPFLPSSVPCCPAGADDLSLPYLPGIYRVPRYVVSFLPARASSTSTSSSSSLRRDRDAIRHSREFYVPTRRERGGRYSSKKVMSRHDTGHSRDTSPYLSLSLTIFLTRSFLLAAREFTPSQPNGRSCLFCKGHVYGELRSCKQHVRRRGACARARAPSNGGGGGRYNSRYTRSIVNTVRACVFTCATQESGGACNGVTIVSTDAAMRKDLRTRIRKPSLPSPPLLPSHALFGIYRRLYVILSAGRL